MYQIRKELREFCAAHRLIKDYPGKCRNLHGHNYLVTVTFQSESLNQYDFVVDFTEVRALCEDWVNDHLDHSVIVSEDDKVLLDFVRNTNEHHFVLQGQRSTSAECFAEFLFYKFNELLSKSDIDCSHGLKIVAVEVAETSESSAIFHI